MQLRPLERMGGSCLVAEKQGVLKAAGLAQGTVLCILATGSFEMEATLLGMEI